MFYMSLQLTIRFTIPLVVSFWSIANRIGVALIVSELLGVKGAKVAIIQYMQNLYFSSDFDLILSLESSCSKLYVSRFGVALTVS